jgi:hypothetical protein
LEVVGEEVADKGRRNFGDVGLNNSQDLLLRCTQAALFEIIDMRIDTVF